jgi:hypothetical protein
MAINFLNSVDLNKNQLIKAAIESQPNNTAAGTGVEGQLYFDTTVDALKIWAGGAWVEVGATSGVETFTNANGTYVANSIVNTSAIGNVSTGTVDLTAVDGTSSAASRFLTKDNKWATIPFGDITAVLPGTYINIDNSTGPEPTVNHDLTTRTNTTSAASPGYGATFTALDSITTNTTGHITGVNTKTVTIPASDDTTYTLPVTAGSLTNPKSGIITLTGSDSSTDPVTFVGTTGRIEIAGNPGASTITVDLTDDVSIVGKIDVLGTATSSFAGDIDMNNNKLTEVKTGTVATDGVNLGQVEALVAGIGLFKGGYNATTGLTTDLGAGNGSLDGASNIALDQGDFFVVTIAGGAFYTQTLEVGDMIFANTTIAANSTPPITDYTVVIQDANIAGAGATDGATAKGVAGFDSASFNVSASGWVQLDAQKNPNGAKQSLNNTAPSTRTESGGVTTFTLNLAAASLFGSGALSQNVKAEVTEGAAPYETVYACVTRSGTASMAIGFTGSVANNAYQVLLTHV